MPDIDDLGVIRELLSVKPPSPQVNDHVRARLNAVIAAAEPNPDARLLMHRTPSSRHTIAVASRARSVRAGRIPIMAGALAAAAGVVVAVSALLPSGHPGQPGPGNTGDNRAGARLTAWTVSRQADGDIDITINQLRNPAGLQSALRAEGLAASVTFSGRSVSVSSRSTSCQPYSASAELVNTVAHWKTNDHSAFLVINPSALPSGTGVAIFDVPGAQLPTPSQAPGSAGNGSGTLVIPAPAGWSTGPLAVGLVNASRQCTG